MKKILIIKLGYSETLDPKVSNVTSYGDVLRTTVLLHLYKAHYVTWLVDEKAYPILKGNGYVNHILIYNRTSFSQLELEDFDTVINLEKTPRLCLLAESIKAKKQFGFRFDRETNQVEACRGSEEALAICRDIERKRNHSLFWQEHLFQMVGAKWQGEEYIFGHKPESEEKYDIGFNYQVGNKWPSKMWPRSNWKGLEKLIGRRYRISWQQGLNNMLDYFKWINSCRLIITSDSFGFHLALALKKKVLVLFGPTNHKEHYFYGLGWHILPDKVKCKEFPCNKSQCEEKVQCLSRISPKKVLREIERIFDKKPKIPDETYNHSQRI